MVKLLGVTVIVRAIALAAAVSSLSDGHTTATIVDRSKSLEVYLKTGHLG